MHRPDQLSRVDGLAYQAHGDARFLRELPIATSRGQILDRNGEALAVSLPVAPTCRKVSGAAHGQPGIETRFARNQADLA